jgi:lincosamide nucleotidyltransferase A/C/D/E
MDGDIEALVGALWREAFNQRKLDVLDAITAVRRPSNLTCETSSSNSELPRGSRWPAPSSATGQIPQIRIGPARRARPSSTRRSKSQRGSAQPGYAADVTKGNRDLSVSDVIEILNWLEAARVDLWLDGGWGHDAVLGEQTRRHDDLDLFVDLEHSERLITALEAHGFAVTERASADAFVLEDADGRQVDVHCARIDALGNGLYRMKNGEDWALPAEGLRGRGTIGDRRVRCMTPELQMLCKVGDFEPSAADYQDVRLLHARFGVEIPAMYRGDR